MIADWKKEIAVAWLIQNQIELLDVSRIWQYQLPRVKASEEELLLFERSIGQSLDPEYRNFLKYANGWPYFNCNFILFGTKDLMGCEELQKAHWLLNELNPASLRRNNIDRSDLFPIGVDKYDADVFAIWSSRRGGAGEVIWFAHEEVERYASFDWFFLAMVDFNRLRLKRLQNGEIKL